MTTAALHRPRFTHVHALRWLARLTSLASIGLLAAFAFGEPGTPTAREWLVLAFFPGGVVLGMVLGWWRELIGGTVAVLSLAAFYACMFALSGRVPGGPYFALFSLPGALFLAAGLAARRAAAAR
jgi:hypothetical protein